MDSADDALRRERHARVTAERVAHDALAKRDQAEQDRDEARAERDALQIEIMALRASLRDLLAKVGKAAEAGRN